LDKITQNFYRKKFEIIIPEIKPIEPLPGKEEGKAAPMAESATSKNPESEEVKSSPSKAAATSEATLKNGAAGKPAPPVPEFKAHPKPGKEEAPGIDSLFMYKPIFVQPPFYLKQKENVYEGYENFSFRENNYEVMQKDIKFLQIAATHNMLNLTEQEFERVIDIFEKIVFIDQK
jgi:hypothetical protein